MFVDNLVHNTWSNCVTLPVDREYVFLGVKNVDNRPQAIPEQRMYTNRQYRSFPHLPQPLL